MSDPHDPAPPTQPAPARATPSSAPLASDAYASPGAPAGPVEDWRPKAIGILTLVGAGVALIMALMNVVAALVVCVTLVTAAYSLAVAVVCLINGLNLLNHPLEQQRPPYASAIMQIVSVVSCDFVNLALGVAILVLLNDPPVRSKFLP